MKDIDRVVVESVENDARLEKGREDLDEHDDFQNDVDVSKKRRSAEARLAVDDQKHHEDEKVKHEHRRPNQHFQLLLHGEIHQHSVVAIANLDTSLIVNRKEHSHRDCHRRGIAVQKQHRVLILLLDDNVNTHRCRDLSPLVVVTATALIQKWMAEDRRHRPANQNK